MTPHRNHFNDNHNIALENAKDYSELNKIALDVLSNMPKPIGQVCGPISSGGLGSIEKNIAVFDRTIQKHIDSGIHMFDQMPFEKPMQRIRSTHIGSREETNSRLLTEFYLPIFESGHVDTVFFIHGWESSHGAQWEREQAKRLGIKIVDLPKDFLDN